MSLGFKRLMENFEDMLRRALDTGISLHRGPFTFEGTWNQEWGGGLYTGDFE